MWRDTGFAPEVAVLYSGSMRKIPFLLFLITLCFAGVSQGQDRPPNIVIIFTDDQGYEDVGVFGAKGFETPHLDQMAAEGRIFTQWYASQAVCSASRTGLLTGCYSNRVGINGALGPGSHIGINPDETTIAELCRAQGYATACFGKWHLGDHEKFLPLQHGFDEYFGIPYSNDMWPFHPTAKYFPPLPIIEGNERVAVAEPIDQEMLTVRLTNRAVDFISRHRREPFFLYVPHPQPHVPLYVSDRFEGSTERGLYGDVIAELDWSVGEILNALKTCEIDEHTLVIFTSDNGPWLSYGTHGGSAGPLREGKGTSWEGGIREACIMRWPGQIPAGTTTDTPGMNIDLLPTIAGLIGADLPERKIDGKDIWQVISADGENPHEGYWVYYKQNELQAVIADDWKLVFPHGYRTMAGKPGGTDGTPNGYSGDKVQAPELYHLGDDIGESTDVSAQHPEVLERLMAVAEKGRAELGDKLTQRQGSGNREPGRITDEQWQALDKIHWPNGNPRNQKKKKDKPATDAKKP